MKGTVGDLGLCCVRVRFSQRRLRLLVDLLLHGLGSVPPNAGCTHLPQRCMMHVFRGAGEVSDEAPVDGAVELHLLVRCAGLVD